MQIKPTMRYHLHLLGQLIKKKVLVKMWRKGNLQQLHSWKEGGRVAQSCPDSLLTHGL